MDFEITQLNPALVFFRILLILNSISNYINHNFYPRSNILYINLFKSVRHADNKERQTDSEPDPNFLFGIFFLSIQSAGEQPKPGIIENQLTIQKLCYSISHLLPGPGNFGSHFAKLLTTLIEV